MGLVSSGPKGSKKQVIYYSPIFLSYLRHSLVYPSDVGCPSVSCEYVQPGLGNRQTPS